MKRKLVLPILVVALALVAVLAPAAWADRGSQVDPADSLEVYLKVDGSSSLLHDYSISDLEALADATEVEYSTIDAMPARVKTIATGVTIDTLIGDLAQYTETDLASFYQIKFTASDGWTRAYRNSALFEERYYYPALFDVDIDAGNATDGTTWDGTVSASAVRNGAVSVQPMLAWESAQWRTDLERQPSMSGSERLRFCIGMSSSDLSSGNSTTSSFGRGVYRIDIIMDSRDKESNVSVSGLAMTEQTAEIAVGETKYLTAKVVPSDATNKDVSWSSSDRSVATVSEDGVVTGVSAGTATITARSAEDASYTATCAVTVGSSNKSVTGISLNKTSAAVLKGGTLSLTATVTPSNATDRSVSWTSSNDSIARVSSSGVVTGVAAGSATITATSNDGGYKATCSVTVTASQTKVTGVTLNKSTLTILKGNTKQLQATVSPANATNSTIYWSTDASGVATVNTDGTVTAKGVGTANITATSEDGNYSDSCKVTVTASEVAATGVTLNKTTLSLSSGATAQLTATMTPTDATNDEVTWTSSNTAVATVSASGVVTGGDQGSATITVKTADGGYTATCAVTVGAATTTTTASFSDISGHWAADSINKMASLGVISGYNDGTFRPNATITRCEFVAILVRSLQKTSNVTLDSSHSFSDTAGSWAAQYISTAVTLGITDGYGNGKFGPNDNITREQMAVMLVKAYKLTGSAALNFQDAAKISSWAQDSVKAAVSNSIMVGDNKNCFNPQSNTTRAEAATAILRVLELKKLV